MPSTVDPHMLTLHHERGGSGPRVVLVHGFTQTLASWSRVAAALRRDREVVAVDLPGHGGSSALRLTLPETAAALGATGGPAVYVGYSLGGRVCLRLAVDRPDLVRGLVLLGATPGIEDPEERAARRTTDEQRARELERDGVAAFLDRWLRMPLFATLPPEAAGRADREMNTVEGLAASLRLAGTGTQEPLWDRLGGIAAPTLLLAGAKDEKFRKIAARMAEHIGEHAEAALVPDAGHAAHLEQPHTFMQLLDRFLARADAAWAEAIHRHRQAALARTERRLRGRPSLSDDERQAALGAVDAEIAERADQLAFGRDRDP